MSRFPVLLPLPTAEELATFKPVPPLTAPRTLNIYAQLAKGRLTVLNVLGAMTGVALSPLPATVSVLLATAAGTALCSAAANTINQLTEVPYDAQMARTRMRPLVRRHIKPLHAATFATVTGLAGPLVLWQFATPLAGAIGAGTMLLYAFVYTPLKRRSVTNTWVGSVVGAAPPVLGWAAVGGAIVPSAINPALLFPPPVSWQWAQDSMLWLEATVPHLHAAAGWPFASGNPLGAAALFAFMFAWQFPHFNPLAHVTREGYAIAGYRMLSVTNAAMNARVALRQLRRAVPHELHAHPPLWPHDVGLCAFQHPAESRLPAWIVAVLADAFGQGRKAIVPFVARVLARHVWPDDVSQGRHRVARMARLTTKGRITIT